jgi:hypothetical protein
VQVRKNKQTEFYQLFTSKDEAIAVARAKRKEIHGEFVRQSSLGKIE